MPGETTRDGGGPAGMICKNRKYMTQKSVSIKPLCEGCEYEVAEVFESPYFKTPDHKIKFWFCSFEKTTRPEHHIKDK